ncbi:hypothetical protein TSAR_011896 [Trichomalopsis sarcophagae]|uniref:Uncharacterized protein n=1 Tax=Trichomalopsis sarcophagae TaxID=543379 RepID=A0A232EH65_9HYME|nr:hypothetical protein TSAR_011896 [Trichomalopsis sarcophagae]
MGIQIVCQYRVTCNTKNVQISQESGNDDCDVFFEVYNNYLRVKETWKSLGMQKLTISKHIGQRSTNMLYQANLSLPQNLWRNVLAYGVVRKKGYKSSNEISRSNWIWQDLPLQFYA